MKILSADKIREGDLYTIKNEPIADIDLMERAANECFKWLKTVVTADLRVLIFCGTGNNGGDGLAIARMLAERGFETEVFLCGTIDKLSANSKINFQRIKKIRHAKFAVVDEGSVLPSSDPENDVIIDALFGSGLDRPVKGFPGKVIRHINEQHCVTISIDIPSGLPCDESVASRTNPVIIHADHTLTFAPPKLAFFYPENDRYTGNWHLLDIGILRSYTDIAETKNFYTRKEDCKPILKKRNRYSHKGTFGHALLVCGSKGKMGASVLAARACLRSGPGLVTVHIPRSAVPILQTSVPEAMLSIDEDEDIFSGIPGVSGFTSVAAGPGLGRDRATVQALKHLIQNSTCPLILDADAINIIGENKTWIPFIPKGSIFTPHPKEFERLVGKSSDNFERNIIQREFSIKYGIYIVLKGAHTAITTPDGNCFFNSTGNPGMATGGSGDVLTGILAGLMAQGYTPLETCILGTYLHGLAGDLAASEKGQEAMIAGDIVDNLGNSFLSLYGKF